MKTATSSTCEPSPVLSTIKSFALNAALRPFPPVPSARNQFEDIFTYQTLGGGDDDLVPSFCHHCGEPYSWTRKRLSAARELIAEADDLNSEERETLSKGLDDLVSDTPATQLAIVRFKKYLPKAGRIIAEGFKSLMIDIASEAVKKSLWPS